MARNNKTVRRSFITSGLIVALAIVGLFLMSSGDGEADQTTLTTPVDANASTQVVSSDIFSGGVLATLAKMVGALLVVIVCIYVGIYLMKRTMGGKYGSANKFNALEVLETTGVGPKQSVTLIRVGEKSVLVGITGEKMAMLTELNAEDTAALMISTPEKCEPDAFSRMLSAAGTQMKKFTSKNRQTALES